MAVSRALPPAAAPVFLSATPDLAYSSGRWARSRRPRVRRHGAAARRGGGGRERRRTRGPGAVCFRTLTAGALLALGPALLAQETTAPAATAEPWGVLRQLVGSWEGEIDGKLGTGRGVRHYELIMGDRYRFTETYELGFPNRELEHYFTNRWTRSPVSHAWDWPPRSSAPGPGSSASSPRMPPPMGPAC